MSSARDFDFLPGEWRVRNRRLRAPLTGSEEWEDFEARSTARLLLDGVGNEDEFRTDHAGGFVGMAFRFFDPGTELWTIYWADSRRPGALDPPLVGSFSGDVGVFHGDDTCEGRPVRVRLTRPQDMSVTWSRPSMPPRSTNAP